MKNLRKIFAVVLVVALVFGLMAVASAANLKDYADASTVTSKEAVDVMAATGIMTGDGTTNWNPTGTFTREQAAKVVASMLSSYAGSFSVTKSSFTDVAATRWSAPYIEYAVSKGVISGRGDGTFGPTDPVTGAQFSVMMLKALGYGKNNEFAANWEIYAIDKGLELRILSGTANFSAPATREQIAQYALNSMFKPWQFFDKDTDQYGAVSPEVTFATKIGLVQTPANVNGVTGYKYTKAGVDLTAFYAAENVIGKSTDGTAISTLTNPTDAKYVATLAAAANVDYYYNGTQLAEVANTAAVTASSLYFNTTAGVIATDDGDAIAETPGAGSDTAYVIPVGAIVSFVNTNSDTKAETVSIVAKTVATLASNPVVNVTTGKVSIAGVLSAIDPAKVPGYDTLKAGDVVLWYKDGLNVYHIEKAKATASAGAYTNKSAFNAYTVGGVAYTVSGLSGITNLSGMTLGTSYVIYTDNDGGYAVAYGSAAATASLYAVVIDTATVTAIGQPSVYQAQILKPDGTVSIVTVSEDWSAYETKLVSYTVNTAGAYVYGATATAVVDGAVTNKSIVFNTAATNVATTATLFLVRYGAGTAASPYTYTAYTGYNAVPTLTDTTIQFFAVDNKASIVYVDAGTAAASTSNVYLLDATNYGTGYAGVTYREYAAIVDGVLGTIKTENVAIAEIFGDGYGYYAGVTIPASGIIANTNPAVGVEEYNETAAAAVANPFGDGVMKIGATNYIYNENTKVFYIDNTGAVQVVTETTVSALKVADPVNFTVIPTTTTLTAVYIWVA